jgi:DEAD/DEAH box helicase domain-containing protein
MDVQAFLHSIQSDPRYAGQIVHVHEVPPRPARTADPAALPPPYPELLPRIGVPHPWIHQAAAIRHGAAGRDVLVATGTASGKSLCYVAPILAELQADPDARALLLFPTKALCQDQFKNFAAALEAAALSDRLAGVYDGDTPSHLRRRLRDTASAVFSNPDMVHAALMPQHARWAQFLSNLRLLVLDELHVYSGIFGSNMTHLLRRLFRLCEHYGSRPRIVACSATIANPAQLAEGLTGRPFQLVTDDGSPRGRRTWILWNPPRIRPGHWRSRHSANVEAHQLMARLVAEGVPTITFSKAKMTAEMIHRYVTDRLREIAPARVSRVTPYRGGYLPEERREIERRLFSGELLGVSTTPALELGIDVGSLEASIIVGYPGTLASFFQQAGRAGRKEQDSVAFLIGLDTSINQYIMSHPEYLFERCVEQAVIDPDNPFVVTGHLRCAAQEIPLEECEIPRFGPAAGLVLGVLEESRKITRVGDRYYHAASELPQHEVSLRAADEANVLIEDVDSGRVLGEVIRYDAEPILHPEAIYMHRGETWRVLSLDLDRNIARVRRVETDYYTQPLGGTDVHHIDRPLREKPFGTGQAFWGEVTAYFNTWAFEKIHFYSLDAISRHGLDLPTMVLETMALWLVPPEQLMDRVRAAGLDAHAGLRGLGYATRMILPLFMTCDTLDFSHTVGSANSPWNAVFIYERYPLGLGFTGKAYDRLHEIMPAVLESVRNCPCEEGCPCCVGKPLRQATTWNVERGEGSIPSKAAALQILEGLLAGGSNLQCPDTHALSDEPEAERARLETAVRRRLERMREPAVFHPITPAAELRTEYPEPEKVEELPTPDVARRAVRRREFDRDIHKRIARRLGLGGLDPGAPSVPTPPGMKTPRGVRRPTDFPGRPARPRSESPETPQPPPETPPPPPEAPRESAPPPVRSGDPLAARARRKLKPRKKPRDPEPPAR